MMKLSDLMETDLGNILTIQDITLDSREVGSGSLFIALPGLNLDGRDFIGQALDRGATAVLAESTGLKHPKTDRVIPVCGLKERLGSLANRFFDHPSNAMKIMAVTGTNGKTSITELTAQLFRLLGFSAGSIGTLGMHLNKLPTPSFNTTPDCLTLHRKLKEWRDFGVRHVAMEASSHALSQGRMDGLRLEVAAFTNLSRDHLDYHGSMDAYLNSKLSLVHDLEPNYVLYNADDPSFLGRTEFSRPNTLSFSNQQSEADIFCELLSLSPRLRFRLNTPWGKREICSTLLGDFNAFNLAMVIGIAVSAGVDFVEAALACEALEPVLGRLQQVDGDADIKVIIDYAHTPDALEHAIKALIEPNLSSELWVVFGCGGDRDRGKRFEMGEVASRLADHVVITSDNPRTESPEVIIKDILEGCEGQEPKIQVDRAMAIRFALIEAATGDTVLIAGKGHEVHQELADSRIPFSDFDCAREALQTRSAL